MPHWSDLTLEEVGALSESGAIAVLPVGAIEQHGPHLATGTDSVLAQAAVDAAVKRSGDVALPVLAYGCSLGHTERWPGTLSLSPMTMTAMLIDLGRWVRASGFRKLVIVNSHATNGPPVQSAILQLRYEVRDLRMRFVSLFDVSPAAAAGYSADAPDFHANEAETSMLLHLASGLVHMDRAVDEQDLTVGLVLQYPMPQVTRSGVVGRPSSATATAGERLFATIVDGLVDLLAQARSEIDPLKLD
jgi:creatinine amidohydrolase